MVSEDPIMTQVLACLKYGPFACTSVVPISGGTANFTYRGLLTSPWLGASSVFIKHAEPFVATNRAYPLDVSRSRYERAMLTSLASLPSTTLQNLTVTTPGLYLYEGCTNTQIMTDYPSSVNLKTYVLTHYLSPRDVFRLGSILGRWLKNFHLWAGAPEQVQLKEEMKGNPMATTKFDLYYGRTLETIDLFPEILGDSRNLFQEMEAKLRLELELNQGEILHGDFWTGNVVLHDGPIPASDPLRLFVVDWELSHVGSRAHDIGHFLAELYLLAHFRSITAGAAMIAPFIWGYGMVGDEMAFRIALHFGVHLIVWPCRVPDWGNKELMENCVEIGKDCCEHAWKKDRGWFNGSVLYALFFPPSNRVMVEES